MELALRIIIIFKYILVIPRIKQKVPKYTNDAIGKELMILQEQTLDNEIVPFRCWYCHEYGYIFRDFAMMVKYLTTYQSIDKEKEGFQKFP